MKMMEKFLDMAMDELKGADEYAECAARHKEDDPQLAKTFIDVANVELGHAEIFLRYAKEYAHKHHAEHPQMVAIYDFESERLYRWHTKIKTELSMLRA